MKLCSTMGSGWNWSEENFTYLFIRLRSRNYLLTICTMLGNGEGIGQHYSIAPLLPIGVSSPMPNANLPEK